MTNTQVKIQDTITEIKKFNSIEKHHSITITELGATCLQSKNK
ncbi:hypothetical protein N8Y88_00230 [Saprospiraceae bacterium]|nr:hypothetical protein [Saprospiraceae bacterium]MDA9332645.1 hypothetical protein [Saprospiraceae bacterium]MDC1305375.1 hypothetical protein [Saprospiraceae bacterium]